MAKQTDSQDAAKKQLWDQLDATRVSMLWVPGAGQHPQPMTHFADADTGVIRFITSSDIDLAVAVGSVADGRLTLVSKAHDYHTSLAGRLALSRDSEKLDELWSIPIATWFDEGRYDPTIRLLKFTPNDTFVWASESNSILVGLKSVRASLTEGEGSSDVGVHHIVTCRVLLDVIFRARNKVHYDIDGRNHASRL